MEGQDAEQVDPATLIRAIEKSVNVPHALQTNMDSLCQYMAGFQDDNTGKINYRAMAQVLENFNFKAEANELPPRSGNSLTSGAFSIMGAEQPRNVFDDDYIVLDH